MSLLQTLLLPVGASNSVANYFGAGVVFPLRTSLVASKGAHSLSHARATTATFIDHEGLVRTALSGEVRFNRARRIHNLVSTKSEDWTNAAWTKSSMTAGATTLTASGANGTCLQTWTGTGNFTLRVQMSRVTGTGNIQLTVDGGSTWTTVTLTGSDQVFSISQSAVTNPSFGIRIVTSGDSINATKIQLEKTNGRAITAPSEYRSVGVLSAPFHGCDVDGVDYRETANGNTVSSNVVTEVVGAALTDSTSDPIGYLSEIAGTNLSLYSEDFSNAAWVKTTTTVGANSLAAPDAETTADTLTAGGANSTVIQDLGVISSNTFVFSVWLRRKTGTGNIQLSLDGGSTWTTKTITSSWAQYSIIQTLANPDIGIRIVTSGDEVYAWGAQAETAMFIPSSYIPTTSATVTRNLDALTCPLGVYSNTAGSVYVELYGNASAESTVRTFIGFAGTRFIYSVSTCDGRMFDGTNLVSIGALSGLSPLKKLCGVWSGSSMRLAATGQTASSGTYDGSWNGAGSIAIGALGGVDGSTRAIVMRNLVWSSSAYTTTQQDALVA